MGYSPATRTVGELITNVKRAAGDESGVVLTNDDIVRWVNDAMDTIVAQNAVIKARATLPLVPGQTTYSVDQLNVYEIETIHVGGISIPSMPFAQAEQLIFRQDPQGVGTGFPTIWYWWDDELTFWPTPSTADTITLYYAAKPEHIINDPTQIIPMPDRYYQPIVQFCLQQAHEMVEDWQAASAKGTQFQNSINRIGEEERTEQHLTYSVITVVGDDIGSGAGDGYY